MSDILAIQSDSVIQLATFYLNDMLIGIELGFVQEINRNIELTPVPDSAEFIRGIINLRGNVVTVIDLKIILELGETDITDNTSVVIVNYDNEQIALLVDKVADVIHAKNDLLEQPPANMTESDSKYFKYIYKKENDLLTVLDIEEILAINAEQTQTEQG